MRTTTLENIDQYVLDIAEFKQLTKEEEVKLANLVHNGTPEEATQARETLITSNLRLVVAIAHDFKRYGVTFADLVEEGNMGLMIAADKYVPGKGTKFSGYAVWWIKQSMRKAIMSQSRTIRIPNGMAQRVFKVERLKANFRAEFMRDPTDEELTSMMGISQKTLDGASYASTIATFSMEEQICADSDLTYADLAAAQPENDYIEDSEEERLLKLIREQCIDMTPLERFIMDKTYGLFSRAEDDEVISQETGLFLSELRHRRRTLIGKIKGQLAPGSSAV